MSHQSAMGIEFNLLNEPRSHAGANSILSQLPSPHLAQLMKAAEPMRLVRGGVLFREGEPGDSCYWVLKGALKISVSSDKGVERILAIVGPGSVVGELAILDLRPRSATVTALSDAHLTILKRAALRTYLRVHPSLWADFVAILAGRLREANKALSADSFLPLHARVARVILHLCDQVGEPGNKRDVFCLNGVSLQNVAAMAGVARESVSRALSEWKKRGIVLRDRERKLLTVNRSMLENETEGRRSQAEQWTRPVAAPFRRSSLSRPSSGRRN